MTRMAVGTIDVDGGSLWYEIAGGGPDVVFLHPGLWDSRTWDDQFGEFSRMYRAIRYDARGYGRSSRIEPGRSYSHARDLKTLLDALDVSQAALVGCSLGGATAIDFALTHPERVSALVLAAPGLGGFEPLEEEEDWWAARSEPIDAAVEAGELETAENLRLQIWAPLGAHDDAGRRIRDIAFDNLHEITMDESGEEELDPPAARRLQEIVAPTLVLIPDHDPPYMQRTGDLIARGVLGARKLVVENADHVVTMRQPEIFSRTVLEFLAEVLV